MIKVNAALFPKEASWECWQMLFAGGWGPGVLLHVVGWAGVQPFRAPSLLGVLGAPPFLFSPGVED